MCCSFYRYTYPNSISPEAVVTFVSELGFPCKIQAATGETLLELDVLRMNSAHSVDVIEDYILQQPGITSVDIDVASNSAEILYVPTK